MKKQFTILLILISIAGVSQDFDTYWNLVQTNNTIIKDVQVGTEWKVVYIDSTRKNSDNSHILRFSRPYYPTTEQYEQYVPRDLEIRGDTTSKPTSIIHQAYYKDYVVEYWQYRKLIKPKAIELDSQDQYIKWLDYAFLINLSNELTRQVGDSILNK